MSEPHPLRKIFEAGGARVYEDVPAPEEFRHEVRWNVKGRLGQQCEIIRNSGCQCQVRFEDGSTEILDRRALQRKIEPEKAK